MRNVFIVASGFVVAACGLLACGGATTATAAAADTVSADPGIDVAAPLDIMPDLGFVPELADTAPAPPDVVDATADIAPDTASDAADSADVPDVPEVVDLGPWPVTEPSGAMFRADSVDIQKPGFCLVIPPATDCSDVSALLNAYLSTHLDGAQPLDIVGLFKPFEFFKQKTNHVEMTFGRGACDRDATGKVTACGFYDVPAVFENTKVFGPGDCKTFDGPLACFSTLVKAGLKVDFGGVPLDLKDAFTTGQFELDKDGNGLAIKNAYVQGFMTKAVAEKTILYIPNLGNVALVTMLKDADGVKNDIGEFGWYFKVNYTMARVPLKL